jgi:hypothetical protein
MPRTRREFLGLTSAGLTAALTPAWLRALIRNPDPDLLVYNAKVYTMDPAAPRVQAFAVSGRSNPYEIS